MHVSTSPWEDLLTEADRQVIERGGYGKPRGLGTSPCVMVIDCQYNYVGADRPIVEQLAEWPAGGGRAAWNAVRHIRPVLDAAHTAGVPVIYTRNVQKRTLRFDAFSHKSQRDHTRFLEGTRGSPRGAALAPREDDVVLDKSYASVFFGTPLVTYLTTLRVDTLLFTGVSTGGCVRASLIDAVTHGFNAAVLADCVADRVEASHKVALLDIWMKYADVIASADALAYLQDLRKA